MDLKITFELVEKHFEFRSSHKLEDQLCCEHFLFFLSHPLSKIIELDTPAEKYLDKIAKRLESQLTNTIPLHN